MHRQLENKDYDPIRWAFDSAKLAKFLVYSEDMHTARHVLASTTKILDDFKTMDQANSKQEEFQFCYANLNRWWAAYCHELLTARLPHLLKDGDRVVVHTVHGLNMEWIGGDNTGFDIKLTPEEFASWRSRCGEVIFASLDTRVLEDQITDQFVLTQRDAEKVVQFAVQKLTNARKYFRSDTHPLNYAEIQIITYRLYFYWANFYEKDGARKCKIYKKGANELEALVAMSSPQYPKDILKKARFSLGTTYSKMLDIKMHRVDQVQKSDEMAINKINKLCVKGITHFTAYLESSCQVIIDLCRSLTSFLVDMTRKTRYCKIVFFNLRCYRFSFRIRMDRSIGTECSRYFIAPSFTTISSQTSRGCWRT